MMKKTYIAPASAILQLKYNVEIMSGTPSDGIEVGGEDDKVSEGDGEILSNQAFGSWDDIWRGM